MNQLRDIFTRIFKAGRRTYFFDVKETRDGDYYLTITESIKHTNRDGKFYFKKHKIFLYKEDFKDFQNALLETTQFIIDNKGEEVISSRRPSPSQNFPDEAPEDSSEDSFEEFS